MNQFTVQKSANIEAVTMGEDLAMLNSETGKYVLLNDIGKEIWTLLDDHNTLELVVNALLAIYDVDKETCQNQVNEFMDLMLEEKIIEYT